MFFKYFTHNVFYLIEIFIGHKIRHQQNRFRLLYCFFSNLVYVLRCLAFVCLNNTDTAISKYSSIKGLNSKKINYLPESETLSRGIK